MLRFLFGSKDKPLGPSFNPGHVNKIDLSGSIFTFSAPHHSSGIHKEYDTVPKVNIYDAKPYATLGEPEPEVHPFSHCYIKAFSFYGKPLVEGTVAALRCRFTLKHADDLAEEETLFNPDVFDRKLREQMLVGHLAGDVRMAGNPEPFKNYTCPHDWQVESINGTEWVHFKAFGQMYSPTELQWHTPISDRHYLTCAFERYLYYKGLSSIPKLEELVNYQPVDKLANDIIHSAKLASSEDAMTCMQRAREAIAGA